jgi:maltose-binding protein MalE
MLRTKKLIALISCGVLLVGTLAGCASTSTPAAAPPVDNTPVTIKVWHPYANAEKTKFDQIVKDFEAKNKNITIESLDIPFAQLSDKSNLAFSSHDTPDVLFGVSDGIGGFAAQNALEPVKSYIPELDTRFMASTVNATKVKGIALAVPLSVECPVLVYNKDLVKTPPKTISDFLTIAKDNTKNGNYGLVVDYTNFYYMYGFYSAFGGEIFKDGNLDNAKINVNTPQTVNWLNFISQIRNVDKIVPSQIDDATSMALFTEGKAAFMLNGPWSFGDLEKDTSKVKGKWAIANYPDGDKAAAPFMGIKVIYIPKDAKYKKQAAKFIEYITSDSVMKDLNSSLGWVPANKNVDVSADFKAQGIMTQAAKAYVMPSIPEMGKVWDPMKDAIMKVAISKADPAKTMTDEQAKIEKDINTLHGN